MTFTINGTALGSEVAVAYGATVTLALTSTVDVSTVEWRIAGQSHAGTPPTISTSGSPPGATATFTQSSDPGDGQGRGWLVECVINGSLPTRRVATGLVGTVGAAGVVPLVAGEVFERSLVTGWAGAVNRLLNVGGLYYSGSQVVPSGGGTTNLYTLALTRSRAVRVVVACTAREAGGAPEAASKVYFIECESDGSVTVIESEDAHPSGANAKLTHNEDPDAITFRYAQDAAVATTVLWEVQKREYTV